MKCLWLMATILLVTMLTSNSDAAVIARKDAPKKLKPDDAKADDAKADKAKADDAKTKTDDAKTDDAKADDAKANDAKAGDTKAKDAKADGSKDGVTPPCSKNLDTKKSEDDYDYYDDYDKEYSRLLTYLDNKDIHKSLKEGFESISNSGFDGDWILEED